MATVIRMPSVMAGSAEAAIARWLIAPGEMVREGAPLAEVETEKAIVEYAAEVSGMLGRIVVAEGASANIGDPIAVLIADGETDADIDAALGGSPAAPASSATAAEPTSAAVTTVVVAAQSESSVADEVVVVKLADATGDVTRMFATPIARKIARERGLDLTSLTGTGPGGRIVRRDVESLAARAADVGVQAPAPTAPVQIDAAQAEDIPLSGMRKAIARRLTESKTTIPHFYLVAEIRVDELLDLRSKLNQVAPVKISVNDFIVKAVAGAFTDVPQANVTWGDTVLHQHSSVDISIAVSTDGGLVTPVVRAAESKSVAQIASEIQDLAARARDKRLRQDELEGGSFSISNLGMYGTVEFSAIINPPQSGILAVGAAKQQAIVVDGELQVATVLRVTLSADHRAIDGALAAQWLAAFVQRVEHPLSLLV